jgi:hypothetical protein
MDGFRLEVLFPAFDKIAFKQGQFAILPGHLDHARLKACVGRNDDDFSNRYGDNNAVRFDSNCRTPQHESPSGKHRKQPALFQDLSKLAIGFQAGPQGILAPGKAGL